MMEDKSSSITGDDAPAEDDGQHFTEGLLTSGMIEKKGDKDQDDLMKGDNPTNMVLNRTTSPSGSPGGEEEDVVSSKRKSPDGSPEGDPLTKKAKLELEEDQADLKKVSPAEGEKDDFDSKLNAHDEEAHVNLDAASSNIEKFLKDDVVSKSASEKGSSSGSSAGGAEGGGDEEADLTSAKDKATHDDDAEEAADEEAKLTEAEDKATANDGTEAAVTAEESSTGECFEKETSSGTGLDKDTSSGGERMDKDTLAGEGTDEDALSGEDFNALTAEGMDKDAVSGEEFKDAFTGDGMDKDTSFHKDEGMDNDALTGDGMDKDTSFDKDEGMDDDALTGDGMDKDTSLDKDEGMDDDALTGDGMDKDISSEKDEGMNNDTLTGDEEEGMTGDDMDQGTFSDKDDGLEKEAPSGDGLKEEVSTGEDVDKEISSDKETSSGDPLEKEASPGGEGLDDKTSVGEQGGAPDDGHTGETVVCSSPKGNEGGATSEGASGAPKSPSASDDKEVNVEGGAASASGEAEKGTDDASDEKAKIIQTVRQILDQRKKDEAEDKAFMDGWYNWIEDLLVYDAEHGHCQVRDSDNRTLYNWLKRQRVMLRKGKLDQEKLKILQMLKTNGFEITDTVVAPAKPGRKPGSGTSRGSPKSDRSRSAANHDLEMEPSPGGVVDTSDSRRRKASAAVLPLQGGGVMGLPLLGNPMAHSYQMPPLAPMAPPVVHIPTAAAFGGVPLSMAHHRNVPRDAPGIVATAGGVTEEEGSDLSLHARSRGGAAFPLVQENPAGLAQQGLGLAITDRASHVLLLLQQQQQQQQRRLQQQHQQQQAYALQEWMRRNAHNRDSGDSE